MKWFIFFSMVKMLLLVAPANSINAQVIYVKQDASSANDGSSWENAYSDLDTALASAFEGSEIWIAAGVYHPGGLSPNSASVYAIHHSMSIYGGFKGTEVYLEERDPLINLTVLSGDLHNDDITDDFINNKFDNTLHVVYIDSLLTRVVIDGVTIKGGNTLDNGNASIYDYSGGGIYATSPVLLNQCHFTENFGREGGAIFWDSRGSASRVINCIFSYNKSTQRGAGLYAANANDLIISNSSFLNNQAIRGAVYPFYCTNILIEDCLFQENHNVNSNGGAVFSFQNFDMVIRNCEFNRNSANAGGAVLVNGSELPADTLSNIVIDQCRFNENKTSGLGGAIYCFTNPDILIQKSQFYGDSARAGGAISIEQPSNYQTDTNMIRIDSCLFETNIAGNVGGAVFLKFVSSKIEHCFFDHNSAKGTTVNGAGGHVYQESPGQNGIYRDNIFKNGHSMKNGGAVAAYGKSTQYLFESCEFSNNHADQIGGAVNNGAHSIFSKCDFLENSSDTFGGALSLTGDSTTLHIIQSVFRNNVSAGAGASASINGSNRTIIENSEFYANKSTIHCGIITSIEKEGLEIGELQIRNSIFGFNETSNFAGVVDVKAGETEITNSVFYENICTGPVGGGVFYFFTPNNATMHALLINNTIVDNHGVAADGLVLSTTDTASFLTTTLQNCIFRNKGERNFIKEKGNPIVISKGGNMSDDFSMSAELNDSSDLNDTEPIFNDPINYDFSLTSDSPGVDDGVAYGAPEFDILGNPRVNAPDMGAYENQFPVGVKRSNLFSEAEFMISPNPVSGGIAEIVMNNSWIGPLEVSIISLSGVVLNIQNVIKTSESYRIKIPLDALSPAVYQVIVSNGEQVSLRKLIRI